MLSDDRGEGQKAFPPKTYTEQFYEVFPFYLSIGMTEEQYWDRDCTLVIYYRKAYQIKQEEQNTMLWLQGRYVYDAILCVSPILHAFAKKGTKAVPYPSEPLPITKESAKELEERKEKEAYEKRKHFMETYMVKVNKSFQ